MHLALDCEATGLDCYHGTKPYFITTCTDDFKQTYWEWDVDPFTREPDINIQDLHEFITLVESADRIVLQNSLYDSDVLETLRPQWNMCKRIFGTDWRFPWERTHDTLLSAHMLGSCQRKDLTTQALVYLNINVQPYEDAIKKCTDKARAICKSKKFKTVHGIWELAKEGRKDMPSAKGNCWKADMWLPRALCKLAPDFLPTWEKWDIGDAVEDHPWQTKLAEYATSDSEVTMPIHLKHERILKEKKLWPIYVKRLEILKMTYDMKKVGVTLKEDRVSTMIEEYTETCESLHTKCLRIADSPELTHLPVNGVSNALRKVVFEDFGLIPNKKTPKGGLCMDKAVMEHWLEELNPKSKVYHFILSLKQYRQRKTAIGYMSSYKKFWKDLPEKGWHVLHPSLNPVGTKTLRWSSSNPNEQNISKKEGFNIRYCFGPAPGRGWASLDYENIELRIPAYGSGEKELIDLFERADDPPYYGSVHLLNFSTVYPDIWADTIKKSSFETAARYIKEHYKDSWYKKCKAGDFAVQYGAVDRGAGKWSTADRAFGRMGSQALLKSRFQKQEAYNQHWIQLADKTGFVETMPDITVCPDRGYPLQCNVVRWGKNNKAKISPTIPLNYHVQGTACWVIFKAMLKVQAFLDKFNVGKSEDQKWYITLQVHDELVIDFPLIKGYQAVLRIIKRLMESCGEDIQVPLRVGAELHLDNWSTGTALAC